MQKTINIVNPFWYIKKAIDKIRQIDKINKLEEEIKKYELEIEQIKKELNIKIIEYKAEATVSLNMALDEEKKRIEIQKELLKTQEKLDKYCTNPDVKKIIEKSNKEIETLVKFIPPERKEDSIVKKSQVHPREAIYLGFLKSLKSIPYVKEIVDKEAKEAKYSRISRIELEEILLIYAHNNCGYRVTVKTTAETMAQQYYIAELIKRMFNFH